ncbi:MAG: hypothetical protein ISF22_10560 [Methanomassiliicoccus sp.]|nr:hypothetical protein [Methanomassiliicoccus sp.]
MQHYAGDGDEGTRDRWLKEYTDPADLHKEYCAKNPNRKCYKVDDMRRPLQIEKDERFWVASSLMSLFHNERNKELFIKLFKQSFKEMPKLDGLTTWEQCLDGKISLFFEANLPSSKVYQEWLSGRDERRIIPYIRDAAWEKKKLEGPTHVDALLINESNGFAAQFEGKLLSDMSCEVTFDLMRNQMARNIDVMLEWNLDKHGPLARRNPNRTVFLLVTPEIIKGCPHSRFYGYKYEEYKQDPDSIGQDLLHRKGVDWGTVSSRLGWATWEGVKGIGSLPA